MIGSNYELDEIAPGQWRHTQHVRPIAYLHNGAYARITDALGNSGDPTFPVGVDELCQFRIKDKLAGQSPVIHFGKGQSMVRFAPLGTNNTNGLALGTNGWRYPEAWNNADLELTIGGHIMQKSIQLRASHPASFSFRIDDNIGLDYDTLSTPDFAIMQPSLTNGAQVIPLTWQKTVSGGKLILTVNLPAGNWAGWTLDPTLILQPGAADGIDTFLISDNVYQSTNFRTNVLWATGSTNAEGTRDRYHQIAKFDFSAAPASLSVISASLALYLYDKLQPVSPYRTWRINRILASNSSWTESGATWLKTNGMAAWAGSAGCDTPGVDYSTIAMYSDQGNPAIGENILELSSSETEEMIANNYGFIHYALRYSTETEYRYYRSSDYTTAAQRPKLTIVYTLGGSPIFSTGFSQIFGGLVVR